MNTNPILDIRNVVKRYTNHTAVNGVSLVVPRGIIFGLLGPNGAGKTSLIRIITTITRADSGEVIFDGQPLNERHPERIGYMPEERGLYKKMKVGEQLLYLAQLKGLSAQEAQKRLQYWFEKFNIMDWWGKKVEELSKGMQQKAQFISTVMHEPPLLILDEPFSGLDPINSNLIKDEILELRRRGTTIIFSTHRMEQVEEMCEEIALVNQGSIILNGPVRGIREQFKENRFHLEFSGGLPAGFEQMAAVVRQTDTEVEFQLNEGRTGNEILSQLLRNGTQVNSFREILPSMNEIFIKQVEHHRHA
jgi:ABC-2 type transport system ATP-binding protein